MLRYECYDAGAGDVGASPSRTTDAGTGATGVAAATGIAGAAGATAKSADFSVRSPLISIAGTVERASPSTDGGHARSSGDTASDTDASLDSAAAALRSWVVGWTHRFDPLDSRRTLEPNPAAVRRLVEAVIDVLLERRPAEQVKRLVSREVFALLTAVTQRRAATRFAARSMVRSIQLHTPGPDAVESTVLVQDGPRVRAVAIRFERINLPRPDRISGNSTHGGSAAQGFGSTHGASNAQDGGNARGDGSSLRGGGNAQGGGSRQGDGSSGQKGGNVQTGGNGQGRLDQGRLEWRCTALQFA